MDKRSASKQSWLRRASNSTIGTLRSYVSSGPPSPTSKNEIISDGSPSTDVQPSNGSAHHSSTRGHVGGAVAGSRYTQRQSVQHQPSTSRTSHPTSTHAAPHSNPQLAQAHPAVVRSSSARASQTGGGQLDPVFLEPLSRDSSPGFPDGVYFASDFLLGAGMVILQPSTSKVVVVYDEKHGYWFLPKGRKDVGESLEAAALREAYEESGYQAEFLPLSTPSNAPTPPSQRSRLLHPNTEPIYMSTQRWYRPQMYQPRDASGGEYLTFWYVGMIPDDAQWHPDTGMQDEKDYRAHILEYQDAMDKLDGLRRVDGIVVQKAYELWHFTVKNEREVQQAREIEADAASKKRAPDQRVAGESMRSETIVE